MVYWSEKQPHLVHGTSRHIREMLALSVVFLSCLPLMTLPSRISNFGFFLSLPRCPISLEDNIVSVTMRVSQLLDPQHLHPLEF